MNSYKNVVIKYKNPDELPTTSQFSVGDNLFVIGDDQRIWGAIQKIWRDTEWEEETGNPQLLNFELIDASGKEWTLNYNMHFEEDIVHPQWFVNFNFYTDLNNSVQIANNNLKVIL